jgi:hypothetical protein
VVSLQHKLLNNSVAPGSPYWNYGIAANSLWTMVDRIGYKLTFWIGGANTSYEHRGIDGGNAGRSAMQSIPAAQQRQALGLILRILRPHRSGLLPPVDNLSFLVTQDAHGVAGLNVANLVRTTQKFLVAALLSKQTLLRLDMLSGLSGFGVAEFLGNVSKFVLDPETLAKEDWDLQRLVAEALDSLQSDTTLPESVASYVAMSVDEVRGRISASLRGIHKPNLPEKQLLAVHLRRLHLAL